MKTVFSMKYIAAVLFFIVFSTVSVFAASDSDFTQTINAGTLAVDIKDDSRVSVANPSVAMSAVTTSFDCQYVGNGASSGTFGSNLERIYVTNPGAANNGWTLTVAATGGATDTWTDGGTNEYDFNDATGTNPGCGDGADTDSVAGQMSLDPTAGSITTDCSSCTNTAVTSGSSDSFEEGSTDDITLINAGSGSDDVYRGYLTGVDVDQTIPPETPAASYTVNLTLTATAQ